MQSDRWLVLVTQLYRVRQLLFDYHVTGEWYLYRKYEFPWTTLHLTGHYGVYEISLD